MFYYVESEVAGALGKGTLIDTSCHPPIVNILEYEFYGWLGDALLESFPCFVITDELAATLLSCNFTGFEVGTVTITASEQFKQFYPAHALPAFVRLNVHGIAGHSDFGTAADGRLVVSARALKVLEQFALNHAEIDPFPN
ncbi:hypothetical protein [Pseudomonas sp. PSKL.D1]|uniref:hypothetical protein n=1 Tax=Pseudomonas sp. PSKL.D1 TaxID=3029060 RepID=UPI002381631C|nr:hypothetical protein [Pseudomonas sp. PSKL.D1]WDY55719.1 hypothetical protein PVV54_13960 [Pseudomonas sp. PSKL.D1]